MGDALTLMNTMCNLQFWTPYTTKSYARGDASQKINNFNGLSSYMSCLVNGMLLNSVRSSAKLGQIPFSLAGNSSSQFSFGDHKSRSNVFALAVTGAQRDNGSNIFAVWGRTLFCCSRFGQLSHVNYATYRQLCCICTLRPFQDHGHHLRSYFLKRVTIWITWPEFKVFLL